MITHKSVSNKNPDLTKSKRFWGRVVWVSAFAVVIPPLLGTLPTMIGMLRASGGKGLSDEVGAKPQLVDIYFAMEATIWGGVISFFAIIIFTVALTFFLRRREALRAIVEENQSEKTLA